MERADDILTTLSIEISQQIASQQNLPFAPAASPPVSLTADEQCIYDLLSGQPIHIDALTLKAQLPSGTVSAILMMLEMKEAIKQLSGKMFVLPCS